MDIDIQDLQVHIQGQKLFSINMLKIKQGQRVLIRGASGKGKSTFLHLLAGLLSPAKGSIRVGDFLISQSSEAESSDFRRKNIGIVFQKLNLIDYLTVFENVLLSSQNDRERALAALNSVSLGSKIEARTSVLSLGEQQRVAVARVLAGNAKVVLADEPTSSLDLKNTNQVMETLLNSIRDKTFIVVSHDERIEKYFDQMIDFEEYCR